VHVAHIVQYGTIQGSRCVRVKSFYRVFTRATLIRDM
jgi:hypothetical protein